MPLSLSLSDLFRRIGAPLISDRQSWGALRKQDDAYVLRVWKADYKKIDGRGFIKIWGKRPDSDDSKEKAGYKERTRHVEGILRGNAKCYMILCEENAPGSPSRIKSFDGDEICLGGEVLEEHGEVWVELAARVRPSTIASPDASTIRDDDEDFV